jgi:hypothetical protein
MPRAIWPLHHGSPAIEVVLTMVAGSQPLALTLLADTGAGNSSSRFELILEESDCLLCGGTAGALIRLGGAYAGDFPLYQLRVQIPQLGFDDVIAVAGVPANPRGFEGIAGFCFVNRFGYGNFGNPGEFGLET